MGLRFHVLSDGEHLIKDRYGNQQISVRAFRFLTSLRVHDLMLGQEPNYLHKG